MANDMTRTEAEGVAFDERAHILDRIEAHIELYHTGGGSPGIEQTLREIQTLCDDEKAHGW